MDESPPLLTVVIPCFNERETIRDIVSRVRRQPIANVEIIVVDDDSQDGTRELLPEVCAEFDARLILHSRNMGKGAALRSGFREATGDIVIVQDADLEYDPVEYGRIIEPILQDRADVVFGSRFMGGQAHRVVYFWHMVGNKFLTLLSNMMTNINLTDMETCYKAFRRELIQSITIEEDRFGVEPEITAKVTRAQARIYEVGISYYGRTYAEGKKIGWRDGVRAIYAILRYNLFASATGSQRHRRRRSLGTLAWCLAIAAAVAVASWKLATPGLYYDEMLFANAAVGGPTGSFVAWRWHGIPVLLMDYIGALKAWIYFPWFAAVPVEPWSVRLPAIFFGVAGGMLLVCAAARLYGRRAAAFAAPLILFDPTLLMHSRIDWGPTALMFFCRGLVIAGIAIWWHRGTPAGLWLAVVAGAAGVFDKLNFLWILAAATVALLVTAGRRLPAYVTAHRWPACLQAVIVLGVLGGGLWRATSLVAAGLGPVTQGFDERIGVATKLLGLAIVGGGPLHVVCGHGMRPAAWMVPAYAAVAAALLIGWPAVHVRARQREWLFVLLFTLSLVAAFTLTKSAEGPHHAAVIAGLPGLLAAPLLAACAPRGRRTGPRKEIVRVAAIGSAAMLAAAMLVSSLVSVRAFAKPTNPHFDPALNALGDFALARPEAVYRTVDWGLGSQLIGLTKGRVRVDDTWPAFTAESTARAALDTRDRSRDLFLVGWADSVSAPGAGPGLDAALAALGLEPEAFETFLAVDRRPVIEVRRIPRDEVPPATAPPDAPATLDREP